MSSQAAEIAGEGLILTARVEVKIKKYSPSRYKIQHRKQLYLSSQGAI